MAELILVPLQGITDLLMLQSWFQDAEHARRIDYPTQQWFDFVTTVSNRFARVAYEGNAPIGFVQYECKPDGTASLAYYVRPDLRGRGYGKQLLQAILAAPDSIHATAIWAGVDPDNLASLRCFEAVGFVNIGPYPGEPSLVKVVYFRSIQ